MLKNYMEEVVDNLIPEVIQSYSSICTCQKCISDIKALTLNKLPPRYCVTNKGWLFTKTNELLYQNKTDIISQIALSVEIVSKNPKHDEYE